MQTRFSSILIAIAAILIFASCSKSSNKQGVYIPKDAAVVVHLNGESLNAKLPWEEIKKSELFKEASADSNVSAYLKTALDNPENTGIDIKNDLIIFIKKDSLGGYVSIVGTLKDAAKFKQFATETSKGGTPSEKDGISYVAKDKVTTSWNKDKFIVVIDAPEMNEMDRHSRFDDFDSVPKPVTYRDGTIAAAQLYNLKEDASLAKDEKFSELMNTKGDVHFWLNGEAFNKGSSALASLSMMNISKLTEGAITTATASFENGQIVADIKSYSGKEMTALWKKYSGSSISSDMARKVPSKDVAAFFAMNFKPEGIREFLKLAGLEGFANMGAGYVGFTVDDFIKANKGDILFVVSDLKRDSAKGKDASFLFATSIGDKAAFAKLIEAGKKAGGESGMGGLDNKISYNSNDNYFAIGNNKDAVDKYITGPGTSPDYLSKISGSPVGTYVNFQYIFGAMKDDVKDSIENEIFVASAKMWDNAIAKGGDFSDGGLKQHIEINLLDKGTNSLKQLNDYLGKIAVLNKLQKEKQRRQWESWDNDATADTTMAPVISH